MDGGSPSNEGTRTVETLVMRKKQDVCFFFCQSAFRLEISSPNEFQRSLQTIRKSTGRKNAASQINQNTRKDEAGLFSRVEPKEKLGPRKNHSQHLT